MLLDLPKNGGMHWWTFAFKQQASNFHDHSELKEDFIGMQKFGYLVTVVCSLVPCPSPLRNVDGNWWTVKEQL